jgi:hypothetical protein
MDEDDAGSCASWPVSSLLRATYTMPATASPMRAPAEPSEIKIDVVFASSALSPTVSYWPKNRNDSAVDPSSSRCVCIRVEWSVLFMRAYYNFPRLAASVVETDWIFDTSKPIKVAEMPADCDLVKQQVRKGASPLALLGIGGFSWLRLSLMCFSIFFCQEATQRNLTYP